MQTTTTDSNAHQQRRLRVRIKELASEAQHIRHEERKVRGLERYDLQQHRKVVVRPAARKVQLAYAILRNTPYHVVERTTRDPALFRASILPDVKRTALRFGATPEQIEAWVFDALAYLNGSVLDESRQKFAESEKFVSA